MKDERVEMYEVSYKLMTTADLSQIIDALDDVDEIDDSRVYVFGLYMRKRSRRSRMCAGFIIRAIIQTFHHECHIPYIPK